jgi:hypothetical protein
MSKRVYVAGPYTKPDPCVNTNTAILAGDRLWAYGLIPFVPHLTHFWHTVTLKPYTSWLAYDMEWLKVCDVVLRLPGESSGADKECDEAKSLGIPVFYTMADVVAWAGAACTCAPDHICDGNRGHSTAGCPDSCPVHGGR